MAENSKLVSFLDFVKRFDLNSLNKLNTDYKPLYYQDNRIGSISNKVEIELQRFPDFFSISENKIEISETENVTEKLEEILLQLKAEDKFPSLQRWRGERFRVGLDLSKPPLFAIERAAAPILGVFNYGVQINGYYVDENGSISMWLQKRAANKPYGGTYDNMAGGGLPFDIDAIDGMIKEAFEEANVPEELAKKAIPVGAISSLYESVRGLYATVDYVFDLELPNDFVPEVNDGEVEHFKLFPANEVMDIIRNPDLHNPSNITTLDFLIRKGVVNPRNEPNVLELIERLHAPIHQIYKAN